MKLKLALLLLVALSTACTSDSKLKPFTNDGCSLFPDGTMKQKDLWCDCCVTHDIAYWQGGSDEQRLIADKKLRSCVLKKTDNPGLAELMYQGVRAGGSSVYPNWYRWGYGWDYGVGGEALTKEQKSQVEIQLAKLSKEPERLACPE